ncbi:MAG: tetratricopeptide repeat protein [Nitrospirota bacterium]
MQKKIFIIIAAIGIIIAGQSAVPAAENACAAKDAACLEFAKLAEAEQFERIIGSVDAKKRYSEAARSYIGRAYLMIAGRETNTPEQEEQFCLKALEYGATSAYMGLYFINAGQNPEKAIGYLKQYIATKPKDSVPYVLLGEAEMEKENYETANMYLREAKSVARGHSTNLDWMLFQVNYLLGDFAYASAMLDGALARGQFIDELKSLAADPRYADFGSRPEFRKYEPLIKGTSAKAAL